MKRPSGKASAARAGTGDMVLMAAPGRCAGTKLPRAAARERRRTATARSLARLIDDLTRARGHAARKPLRRRIAEIGADVGPALSVHLDHPDCFTRWEVVNLLGELVHPATLAPVVEFALSEDEVHARWRSFWAVSRFDRAESVPLLLEALAQSHPTRRWRAALMLSVLRRSEAVPTLLEGLDSDDPWIQWEALSALKSLRPEGIEGRVKPFLARHRPRAIRQEAVLALGALGSAEAVKLLARAIRDSDPQIRWRASMGLARSGGRRRLSILYKALAREQDEGVLAQLRLDIARLEKDDGKT